MAKTTKMSLSQIRKKMKKGEMTSIAWYMDYSPSHVSNVLNGRRNNKEIVAEATAMVKGRK